MFEKLVAIEPVSLIPSAEEKLHDYAKEVVLYRDIPADDEEIIRRIGDADAALLSYTSRMGKNVIERCPNLKYIDVAFTGVDHVDLEAAKAKGVKILVFPELTLTGCSCFDLIAHRVILDGAKAALAKVIAATDGTDMLVFVGLPYAAGSRIYSCAAAICDGELLGLGLEFRTPDNLEVHEV